MTEQPGKSWRENFEKKHLCPFCGAPMVPESFDSNIWFCSDEGNRSLIVCGLDGYHIIRSRKTRILAQEVWVA